MAVSSEVGNLHPRDLSLRIVARPWRVLFGFLFAAPLLFAGHSKALPPDPAARGLDLFLHVPPEAAPGATFDLTTEAFGFATVTQALPLGSATVEAGWDPESLDGAAAPPNITAKTDAAGRAQLSLVMPPGEPKALTLLVAARHGVHTRTRTLTVARTPASSVELHVADSRVVPGSTISAWGRVAGLSGRPLPNTPVVVSLLEGGVPRFQERLVSDRGGLVMARVPIPRVDEPVWRWTLTVAPEHREHRSGTKSTSAGAASVDLTPRQEIPGTPTLEAHWDAPASGVLPGDRVAFSLRLRDATGQPLIDQPLRWWAGLKGTTPPSTDEEWKKVGTVAKTDGAGRVTGSRDAPTLVKSTGTSIHLVAEALVEGHGLSAKHDVTVGIPRASAELMPESGHIVPGIAQRIFVRILDGKGDGIAAPFRITGDGLAASFKTDAKGEGEVTWNVPAGVGATRSVGPCAGSVAAAITIKQETVVPALERDQREGFVRCVAIDRDAEGIVRVEPSVARPGDKVRITIARARADRRTFSVVLRSDNRTQSVATWLETSGEITLPVDASDGTWTVSAALPEGTRTSPVLGGALMIVPKTLPLLTAKRVGGRATPGGAVEVEATLTDGLGHGLQGAVSAVVVDAFGGGDARVSALDTRSILCRTLDVDQDRCAAALSADPSTDALRRAGLSSAGRRLIRPSNDPGAHAETEMRAAFAAVLRSLEGAVFEATNKPETLIDVRRKEGGRWVFNPELFTLVTDAMNEPPTTPGGEPLKLSDLAAVDPQVTFDNVARRVTRLKLFRLLAAVRAERANKQLDPDEPVFRDPNALVRRLVRSGALTDDALLDPWGGTIQFVRSQRPPIPFLSVVHGWELRAPGPDGVVDTGDDVGDPFARILRSGSPYATAVEEDRIVDAKWDMVVSEETVRAWERLFEELTGSKLGGVGLSGIGEGGGGRGEGIGLGSVGTIGHGHGSAGISTGDAFWSAPVRTDAEGRVKLTVPLGDVETTWRVALVGVPDGQLPASTTLDVPSEAPLSGRVDTGARWVAGDEVVTNITVRNRTKSAVRATVTATAEGVASVDPKSPPTTIDVPANGARRVRVRVAAKEAGSAALVVTTRAPGLADDVLRHTWEVVPRGERRELTQTGWVDGDRTLGISLDHGYSLAGEPRLVLERGYDDAVAAALDSLEPERQTSTEALVDALEAAIRIERWATQKSTPRHRAIAAIAKTTSERALGRFEAFAKLDETARGKGATGTATATMPMRMRVDQLTKRPKAAGTSEAAICPPQEGAPLDVEPAPTPEPLPCWNAHVSNQVSLLDSSQDPVALATAVLALADRPHRAAVAKQLAERLRRVAKLQPSGDIDVRVDGRAARATVFAALLRAQKLGSSSAAQESLFGKIAPLRDTTGAYGSSTATLAVVRALLESQLEGHGTTRARVRVPGGVLDQRIDVPASGFATVKLPANALDVEVETQGPGLIARLERPVLRSWTRPPPPQRSPVNVEIVWPAEARAESTGVVRILLRHEETEPSEIDVRIPLPPGVRLAAATDGVMELQGALMLRKKVGRDGTVVEAPVRFGLGGTFTVPEASARLTRSPRAPATAPARALVVR
jgi:hypothetical protein